MPHEVNHRRRRFFGSAAMTIAVVQLGMIGSAHAQAGKTKPANLPRIKPGTITSFPAL